MKTFRLLFLITVTSLYLASVEAEELKEFKTVIKDHSFIPNEIIVPANEKFTLVVDNQDPTPEEFESYDLNREKIVKGGKSIKVFLGPLDSGRYEFFGEFNPSTAKGAIIAK